MPLPSRLPAGRFTAGDEEAMILINFTHPLTAEQTAQLDALLDGPVTRVIAAAAEFDQTAPFAPQATALVDDVGLAPDAWQTEPIVINPPALHTIAAIVLAELHGRMGYFPPIVRLRPVAGSLPSRYEVAEVLPLQAIREAARQRRRPTRPPAADGP